MTESLAFKRVEHAESPAVVDRVAFACRGLALTGEGSISRQEVRLTMTVRDLARARHNEKADDKAA